MNISMGVEDSSFLERSAVLTAKMTAAKQVALKIIAEELLRLSQREVPFVTGELMASGVAQKHSEEEWIVGYNKVYAAYMHEGHWIDGSHRIKHYSNNRKGKYLEDPMKINKEIFTAYFGRTVKAEVGII